MRRSPEASLAGQDPRQIAPALRDQVRRARAALHQLPAGHPLQRRRRGASVSPAGRARNRLANGIRASRFTSTSRSAARRCLFCGCHTFITRDGAVAERYVDALRRARWRLAAARVSRPADGAAGRAGRRHAELPCPRQQPRPAARLAWRSSWRHRPGGRALGEIDPRTRRRRSKLDAFLAHGFNRFSLGVQDLEPRRCSRRVRGGQDLMQVEEVVGPPAAARLRGHQLRSRSTGCRARPADGAAPPRSRCSPLRPSRIALYSYAHVPWIRRTRRRWSGAGCPTRT